MQFAIWAKATRRVNGKLYTRWQVIDKHTLKAKGITAAIKRDVWHRGGKQPDYLKLLVEQLNGERSAPHTRIRW